MHQLPHLDQRTVSYEAEVVVILARSFPEVYELDFHLECLAVQAVPLAHHFGQIEVPSSDCVRPACLLAGQLALLRLVKVGGVDWNLLTDRNAHVEATPRDEIVVHQLYLAHARAARFVIDSEPQVSLVVVRRLRLLQCRVPFAEGFQVLRNGFEVRFGDVRVEFTPPGIVLLDVAEANFDLDLLR